ncbi:MAG: hypothetical protein JWQ27_3115 [Ferruginibacter sp.]|nr:hypothetical protein [Ferruginibacter sp.]
MLLSHPAFQLYSATLYDTLQQGIYQNVFLPNIKKDESFRGVKNIDAGNVPIGLRWTMHPELGFPRKPFIVYRRQAKYNADSIIRQISGGNEAISLFRAFFFPVEMYVMAVSVTIPAGQSILLTPLGRDNILMRAKAVRLTASGSILFKAPFMTGVYCEGIGAMNNLAGVTMDSVINATDWEKIQVVGFPFKKTDVGGLGYKADPQGFVSAPTTGVKAAEQRLKMGEWLFMPPANINALDAQCNNVSWKHPAAIPYLQMLGHEQLLSIRKCLTNSDDLSFDRNKRQISYVEKTVINGISQTGSGLPPKPAEISIPVVKHTLLSVSNESPAALGLGFGTYDFVPLRLLQPNVRSYAYMSNNAVAAASNNFLGFDYMVTAEYIVRPFEEFPFSFLDDLSKKITFCALNDERANPMTPEQIEVFGIQKNRPEIMDGEYTEAIKLRWKQGFVPHGFGMAANYKPGPTNVMNDPYDFAPDIYKNFFTPVPKVDGVEQDADDIGKFVLTETDEPVPLYGTALHKYFIAGWDLFGRWTPWVKKGFTAQAVAPQQPGIMSIRLELADPENMQNLLPNQPEVDAHLEIDFGWDWIDRSPARIQIAGQFFNAALNDPPATVPAVFGTRAGDFVTPPIDIIFSSTNPNVLPTTSLGTITIMQPNPPSGPPPPDHVQFGSTDVPSNNLKRYKLRIPDIKCSFPGIAPFEVAYTAYIRGLETVRKPINEYSPWAKGYVSRLADPRPPAVTVLPATVLFTAVPDATKLGRGKLTWPAATGALAYHLWEASETAVRVTLDKILRDEFPSDNTKWLKPLNEPYTVRATQLRDLLAQAKYSNPCQRSFNKITKDPVKTTSYELALPGSSDVMYLYQVSSVNSANIESAKSNTVFYAVPKVIKPAAPMLQVRPYKKRALTDPVGEGLEVKIVQTIGDAPLGYQLYRTRKKILSSDVGMKGLPVYDHTALQWSDTVIQLLDGTTYHGKQVRELGIDRSWRPYVYQAVAIGIADASRGKLSGESNASTTEIVYFPPVNPPALLLTSAAHNAFSSLFVLTTTAPFDKVDLGKATIEIYTLDTDNNRRLLKTFTAHESSRSATILSLATTPAQADELPKLNHQPPNTATGITQFSVCVKSSPVKLIIKITDPLNKATEIKAET